MAIVRVRDLVRYYGHFPALDGVSFSVEKGEVIGVLGLNGAGKSTCLRILAGLLTPTSGSAEVGGRDVLDDPIAVRAQVGFLPEEPPLYRHMTVDSFLRHTGQLKGMSRADVAARLPEVCERTGLDLLTRRRLIDELSHGYRKRVGIAQAILHKPALVILDEPISGLDPAQIVEMRRTVRALREEHSVLVSSHILTEISQTCDRILVLHEGRLVAEGTEDELTSRADRKIVMLVRGESRKIESVLQSHPGIIEHSLTSEPAGVVRALLTFAEEGDGPKLRGHATPDPVEDLVSSFVREGLGVRRVTDAHEELETVFLHLTGSTLSEGTRTKVATGATMPERPAGQEEVA